MYYIVFTMSFKIWIIIMKFVRVIIIYLLIQEVQGSIYCLEKQGGLCNHSPNEKQFFRNSVLMK